MEVLPVYELPFATVVLLFMIFSFAGWCAEVLYVGIFFEHKFVNRGFLHGPVCPIYGFGGLVILLLPKILYPTWIPLFLASMVLCTAVEYFISWLLEKMFHTLWWDYSHYKVNINGRVCLVNSLLFGLMGVAAVHFVIPYLMLLINKLSTTVIQITASVLAAVLCIDLIFTIRRLVDFNATMEKVKTFAESLKDHYASEEWFRSGSIAEMLESVKEHSKVEANKFNSSLLEKIESMQSRHKNIETFIKKFPTLNSKIYKDELSMIRFHMKQHHEK